jgi:hypothetical protein
MKAVKAVVELTRHKNDGHGRPKVHSVKVEAREIPSERRRRCP